MEPLGYWWERNEPKTCPHCGERFIPRRQDYPACGKKECRRKQRQENMRAYNARRPDRARGRRPPQGEG